MECGTITHVLALAAFLNGVLLISSEEPFCGNKCLTDGVISFKSCHCDEFCWTLYGDCCADARLNPALQANGLLRRQDVICKPTMRNRNTYVITGCNPTWQGPVQISRYCQQLQREPIDPVGGSPATNYQTGVTYANYYCAVCNNDSENLVIWNIRVSCPSHPNVMMEEDEILQRIIYNQRSKQWGYVVRDSFYGCSITYNIPREVEEKIRRCYPDEVSMCSESWKNDFVKEMCRSYTDPVFGNGTRFKNFYCAICNRVDQSQMTCGSGIGYRTDSIPETESSGPMSFSFLLDVNQSDGNKVGKKAIAVNCKKGEVPDPFAKRCRNVVCGIPGYVMREGRCTLESRRR